MAYPAPRLHPAQKAQTTIIRSRRRTVTMCCNQSQELCLGFQSDSGAVRQHRTIVDSFRQCEKKKSPPKLSESCSSFGCRSNRQRCGVQTEARCAVTEAFPRQLTAVKQQIPITGSVLVSLDLNYVCYTLLLFKILNYL